MIVYKRQWTYGLKWLLHKKIPPPNNGEGTRAGPRRGNSTISNSIGPLK